MRSRIAVQARIYPFDTSSTVLFSRTANTMLDVQLPYNKSDGTPATLGDPDYGFIPELYPRFDVRSIQYNSTFNRYEAEYEGRAVNNSSYLFSGPYRVNDSLSLASITLPIINNTSNIDTLGWLTTVLDASLVTDIVNQLEGLGDSGLTMLFGPENATNNFPAGYLYNSPNPNPPENAQVRFLVPPTVRSDVTRHGQYDVALNPPPFDWTKFPAVKRAYTEDTGATSNSGSMISTRNEEGDNVAIGFGVVSSPMVDWVLIVEQAHSEVWGPIYHLRNVILACVFGTMGAMILLTFPIAHYSSRPIRRLRDATKKTVAPHLFEDDISLSSENDGANDAQDEALARKEGFFGQIIHYRRNQKANKAEKRG